MQTVKNMIRRSVTSYLDLHFLPVPPCMELKWVNMIRKWENTSALTMQGKQLYKYWLFETSMVMLF